jgi:hypothetical protein
MQPTAEERTQLIDKVQKLLAKAEATTFPEEAKSFRNKAADLMAKYAIEHADFNSVPDYIIIDLDLDGDEPENWQIYLVNAVCRFNGMLCVTHASRAWGNATKAIQLIGTASDHAAFAYMYDSALRQLGDALCGYLSTTQKHTATDKTKYMLGFAYGLNDKVRELLAQRDNKIQEYGLVPVNNTQLARNWYEQTQGKLSMGKASSAQFERAGHAAGKNAHLNKGVQHNTPQTRLQIGR